MDGTYFVAEITGPWQYRHEGGHIRPDIVNFRPARIVRVGLADAVPGSICSAFVPARTLQKIARPGMEEFSAACVGRDVPSIAGADLFGFLSPTDIENLVAVYLQTLGWLIIPGSRRADTPHYEYVLVNSATGERAIAQVKSGAVPIDAGAFAGELKVFLFAASGAYGGDVPINVRVLARAELEKFIRARPELLPRAVSTWMEAIGWS
ncbi:MAG: hypothetical protein JNJ63_10225 [Hyphomonadaceae bacterium]|nr:hypothetical protein [Hyphomonadaceae bacterium]